MKPPITCGVRDGKRCHGPLETATIGTKIEIRIKNRPTCGKNRGRSGRRATSRRRACMLCGDRISIQTTSCRRCNFKIVILAGALFGSRVPNAKFLKARSP